MFVLETLDRTGRVIHIALERLSHFAKHPGVINRLEDIKDALQHPLKIISSTLDPDVARYYKYYKLRKHGPYLCVVVKYLNGRGFVITAYFANTIK